MESIRSAGDATLASPRVALDQWRAFRAVVEADGYAQAALRLNKSQSAITYAVQKLERQLGVKVFRIDGRKSVLTAAGEVLLRRARFLLDEAAALENAARQLEAGWEPEIRLAVDIAFPTWMLLKCLDAFSREQPAIRIDLLETVLGGTEQALVERQVDLAISPIVPSGFFGDPLLRLRFIAVAAPAHPLHKLGRSVTPEDLRRYRQLVIRDSGPGRTRDAGWLGADARWTVAHKATSIRATCMGLGFAWYADDTIRDELAAGTLKPLPLQTGAERYAELYLVLADPNYAGPGARRLATLLHEATHAPNR